MGSNIRPDGNITQVWLRLVRPMKLTHTCTTLHVILVLHSVLLGAGGSLHAENIGNRLDASSAVLNQIMSVPDKSIPSEVLANAKCIAVIPSVVKIAFGLGARHGKGVATCRVAKAWSAPGPISITGGSIGLQIGSQSVDLVMVIMDQAALERLLSSKFKIGTGVDDSPGPIGERTTEIDLRKSAILSYSRSRGAFAGVDLKGAAVTQDKDATIELYGRYIPIGSILTGKVRPPANSHPFLSAVRKYTSAATNAQ